MFVARKSIDSPIGAQETHTVNTSFVVLARFAHVLISCQIEFLVKPPCDVGEEATKRMSLPPVATYAKVK